MSYFNLKEAAVQNVATAGTRLQLPNLPCKEVMIIAKRLNTGYIYVGKGNVSSSVYGIELATKESCVIQVNNTNEIWLDASISGEGVSYIAI